MDNKFLDIISNRRSIRTYTDEAIPEETLEMIARSGLMSPRGRNLDTVELIVVRDKSTLEALSGCRPHGPKMLAGASAAIVVLGNEDLSDVWTEDCSAAMVTMHMMADSLGVGSCWVQVRNRESQAEGKMAEDICRELLGFPENLRTEAILSLGMPKLRAQAKSIEDVNAEFIHREKY